MMMWTSCEKVHLLPPPPKKGEGAVIWGGLYWPNDVWECDVAKYDVLRKLSCFLLKSGSWNFSMRGVVRFIAPTFGLGLAR
jgi:hypothetical protein